jgi:hypothetical protein
MGTGGLSSNAKRPEGEADHSSLSTSEVMNTLISTSTPLHVSLTWRIGKILRYTLPFIVRPTTDSLKLSNVAFGDFIALTLWGVVNWVVQWIQYKKVLWLFVGLTARFMYFFLGWLEINRNPATNKSRDPLWRTLRLNLLITGRSVKWILRFPFDSSLHSKSAAGNILTWPKFVPICPFSS